MHIFNESPYFVSPHFALLYICTLEINLIVTFKHKCSRLASYLQNCLPQNSNVFVIFCSDFYWTILVLSPLPGVGSIQLASEVLPKHLSRLTGQTSEASDVMHWPERCVEGWKSGWCLVFKRRECRLWERERRGIDPDFVRFEV